MLSQELDHVSTALIEKAAKLKRVELLHQTAVVEVQARTCELEDVIQQNKEVRVHACSHVTMSLDLCVYVHVSDHENGHGAVGENETIYIFEYSTGALYTLTHSLLNFAPALQSSEKT